jgi:predicted TIM-barrel fold metal-dependent hydrolase
MGHPHHYPIYAEAAEARLPIVVHPNGSESTFMSGPSSAGGVPSTFLERHVTLSQAASSSLCSMIWRGVFDRFPNLKVILVEYGFTWAPWLASQLDREWKSLPKSDRPTRLEPSQYIWNQVRFTTQPLEEPDEASEMIHALEAIHADRTVLFSSDYPHWDSDDPNRVLTYLDRPLRNRICSGNALETFGDRLGLKPGAAAPAAVGI